MPQTTIQSGGTESIPMTHYRSNKPVYEYIENRLERTRQTFMQSNSAGEMLRHSAEYAVISVQTNVDNHERAFVESRGVTDQQELADVFADNVVQYHNNKARYVAENRESVDFDALASRLKDGEIDAVHSQIVDECLGLGAAKSAFTLCMLGFTEKICVDSHTAHMAGLDRYASSDTTIDEYRELSEQILGTFESLRDELPAFVVQWILFDADKGFVETHDPFYFQMERITGQSVN